MRDGKQEKKVCWTRAAMIWREGENYGTQRAGSGGPEKATWVLELQQ